MFNYTFLNLFKSQSPRMVKNPCQLTIDTYHCYLLFPKSCSVTFTARSCYIYKLHTQIVINNGSSVQKNLQCTHFSQLWKTGSNHLRQELTLELFFLDLTKAFATVPHRALLENLHLLALTST